MRRMWLVLVIVTLSGCAAPLLEETEEAALAASYTPSATLDWRTAIVATQTAAPIHATNGAKPPPTPNYVPIYLIDRVGKTAVYRYGGNLCLIHADADPVFLNVIESDRPGATISPDGKLILFTTIKKSTAVHPAYGSQLEYSEIWAMDSAGGEPRLLTTTEQFMVTYPDIRGEPQYWEWIPGTLKVAFSSVYPPWPTLGFRDVHLLDAASGEYQLLVPPFIVNERPGAWGSPLNASPDGKYIAYGTDSSLSLIGTNGENAWRDILIYDSVETYGEYALFALPTWASDSSGMWVTVPPTENETTTEVYFVSVRGEVRPIVVIPSRQRFAFVSPDGQYVVYPEEEGLSLVRLNTKETVFNFGDFVFVEWLDETSFTLSATRYTGPQYPLEIPTHLANVNGTIVPIESTSSKFLPCAP